MLTKHTLLRGTIEDIEKEIVENKDFEPIPNMPSIKEQLEQLVFIDSMDDEPTMGLVYYKERWFDPGNNASPPSRQLSIVKQYVHITDKIGD